MLVENTLRLLGFTLGTGLHLFLAVVLARKRGAQQVERLLLAVIVSSGLWHAANALAFFHRINTGLQTSPFLNFADQTALLGLALTPALLFHLCLSWTGRNSWIATFGYAVVLATWWLRSTGRMAGDRWVLAASLVFVSLLCLSAAARSHERLYRRFFRWLAVALAVSVAGMAAGENSATAVWAALAPPLCFAYFVYRYDFLGLLISRRVVFALSLGVLFAFYLFLVRRVADFVEEEFDFLGPLTELALILAAAMVWLPLYAWMTRFLSKHTQLYADFSKRLIEEAARILDLPRRVQFLAEEVGRTFNLRRGLLVTTGEPRYWGRFGSSDEEIPSGVIEKLENELRKQGTELVHSYRAKHTLLRELLEKYKFNYLFSLWYEDHLTGLLLLDTSPKIFLDQDEPILLGLCRQISLSIETCRVVEEKIGLEKTLLQQEHLARLGKAAAAIAHEVKNPLSSIKTLAQLMHEDPEVAQRYSRDLSYMIGEIDRLNRSVQQLLSFSRPAPEVESEVNLTDMLETTTRILAQQHANDGIRIEYRRGPSLRLERSKPELIQQIVLNLTLNAIQASDPGGAIVIGAEPRPDGKVAIWVDDQGPGIPADLQKRIFEPFFTTKQKGTGLGLAIVKKNVSQLRGELEIESPIANGSGTRVTVILPVQ